MKRSSRSALTLWDMVGRIRNPVGKTRAQRKLPLPALKNAQSRRPAAPPSASVVRYEAMQRDMLDRYDIRVRKWRSSTSGVAWQVTYQDGKISRLIESPKPRGPVSAAVFLHEIGHHAIGFGTYRLRCLEEYHAWRFALEQMREHDITITERVEKRVHDSLVYAVAKAVRRGLKEIPVELLAYLPPGVSVVADESHVERADDRRSA